MGALEAFAAGLRRVRSDRGLTQQRVADRAGVSLQFYAALEQGKKAPSFETLDALAQVLGTTAAELFATGEPVREKRSGPSDDLRRAIERLPRAFDPDLLEVVHAISRMTSEPARAKPVSKAKKSRR